MQRTNVYVTERQLDALRRVGERRGQPVAVLIREAVDAWLEANGVRPVADDEWARRFDALLDRRRTIADESGFSAETAERDVMEAVREVRKARPARRR